MSSSWATGATSTADGVLHPFFRERLALAPGAEGGFLAPAGPWQVPAGVQVHDLVIDDPRQDARVGGVPVRLYTPSGDGSGPRPGLLWLHGGGFTDGSIEWGEAHAVAAELADRAGAVVVSVGYRLVDDDIVHPAPLHDVLVAWRWFGLNAARFGVGPVRHIGGASAGATLAAACAALLRDSGEPAPAGMLLAYGVFHCPPPAAGAHLEHQLEVLPEVLRHRPAAVLDMFRRYAGPLAALDASAVPGCADLRDLPPALLVACEYDDLRTSTDLYADQLAAAGVEVRTYLAPGVLHGHLNWFPSPALPEVDRTIDVLAGALADPPVSGRPAPGPSPDLPEPTRDEGAAR